jgi:hypothetical protein
LGRCPEQAVLSAKRRSTMIRYSTGPPTFVTRFVFVCRPAMVGSKT